ncbi:nuclease-related domain-containing protein [Bacillus marasmi]|uniref:nuclease-related domain-containing protein n=1 Tax=Bacillus marasmi TaxID=1926279 RepID=UPI0011C7A512|nr:nuclease-related domain-containing protein [Bacillus marasmi]
MFMNKRKKSRKLEFLEAILGRIRSNHSMVPVIKEQLRREQSGHKGELTLDSYLHYLPYHDYYIIKGLRLANDRHTHFQIDTLLLSPTHIPIIEAKNLAGTIEVDENRNQMIQNGEIGYENPMLQAQFQLGELHRWLARHSFPIADLEYLVAMTNQSCVLKTLAGSEAEYRVCRGRSVIPRLNQFSAKHQQVFYSQADLQYMSQFLLNHHVEPTFDIEKMYKIKRSEIPSGVHCPCCGTLGMKYHGGSWHCHRCGCKSKDAHLKALKDYYLIYGPEFTNKQFREFLGLESMNIASKLLVKLKLPNKGAKKNRVYILSLELII